jgi:ribosomal protein S18 acetylase RimI-like enzyme
MKVKIRKSLLTDLDGIYQLNTECFKPTDQWYRAIISNYLNKGIVIENTETQKIIGVLLEGDISACNPKLNGESEFSLGQNNGYKPDIFEPVNKDIEFDQFENNPGIVMICIHPDFRGKKLAQKLIEKHFSRNKDNIVCLHTRRSNINAYSLYKKMGYEHVAYIKNKYFQPNEDSIFMIKEL